MAHTNNQKWQQALRHKYMTDSQIRTDRSVRMWTVDHFQRGLNLDTASNTWSKHQPLAKAWAFYLHALRLFQLSNQKIKLPK